MEITDEDLKAFVATVTTVPLRLSPVLVYVSVALALPAFCVPRLTGSPRSNVVAGVVSGGFVNKLLQELVTITSMQRSTRKRVRVVFITVEVMFDLGWLADKNNTFLRRFQFRDE